MLAHAPVHVAPSAASPHRCSGTQRQVCRRAACRYDHRAVRATSIFFCCIRTHVESSTPRSPAVTLPASTSLPLTTPARPLGELAFNLSEYLVVLDKPLGLSVAPDPSTGQARTVLLRTLGRKGQLCASSDENFSSAAMCLQCSHRSWFKAFRRAHLQRSVA